MNEARTFLNSHMGRGVHFMGAYEDPTSKGSFTNVWERFSKIGAPPRALVDQQRQHIKDLDRWAAAFESLFKRSLTPAFQHETICSNATNALYRVVSWAEAGVSFGRSVSRFLP
jgi:hypothetical protein